MGTIRDMAELQPRVRAMAFDWMERCAKRSLHILVAETRRTMEVSRAYWVNGRLPFDQVQTYYAAAGLRPLKSNEYKIITKAKPGQSWHIYGCALDFYPMVNGVVDWNYTPDDPADYWDEIVAEAKAVGFAWGGDWRTFQDRPHIEYHPGWSHPDEAITWVHEHHDDWRIPLAA